MPQESPDEELTAAQRQVAEAARTEALAFLTVDHADMDPLIDAVLAGATGDFAEQYASQREKLTSEAIRTEATSTAEVVALGVGDLDDDSADGAGRGQQHGHQHEHRQRGAGPLLPPAAGPGPRGRALAHEQRAVREVTAMTTQKRLALALALLVLGAVVVAGLARPGTGDAGAAIRPRPAPSRRTRPWRPSSVKDSVRERRRRGGHRGLQLLVETLGRRQGRRPRIDDPGDMLRRYDRTMAGVATSSRRDRTVVSAEVVGTGLVTATSSYARVLVFVNQSTTGDDLDRSHARPRPRARHAACGPTASGR